MASTSAAAGPAPLPPPPSSLPPPSLDSISAGDPEKTARDRSPLFPVPRPRQVPCLRAAPWFAILPLLPLSVPTLDFRPTASGTRKYHDSVVPKDLQWTAFPGGYLSRLSWLFRDTPGSPGGPFIESPPDGTSTFSRVVLTGIPRTRRSARPGRPRREDSVSN